MSKTNTTQAWTQVEELIEQGISVIPVWDEDRTFKGKPVMKKQPCLKWQAYQEIKMTKEELWHKMEMFGTSAVAMVCGKVSNNMEVIDIDVKHKKGIDASLFKDIRDLFPDVFQKLRVHKTPSGGYHIPYYVTGGLIPGNQKLAGRLPTEIELAENPKLKVLTFIETRGEGGYVAAPPSQGYSVVKPESFPTITWEERCGIIAICQAYNEAVKPDPVYKATKQDDTYYDQNPFEHFNNACDPVATFEEFGWKLVRQSGNYLWFTRPGGKKGDVHASFNVEKRYYYIFSTNAGLNSDRAYLPASVVAYYKFNDDKQKMYHHLVASGYGRIKPNIEKKMIKTQALRGKPLPPNASQEAQLEYIQVKANLDEQHPYGIYWMRDEDNDGFKIDREHFYAVAEGLGFRYYQQEIIKIDEYLIEKVDERTFYDQMKAYIVEEDYDTRKEICNAFEAFIQKNGSFSITRLALLNPELVLEDNRQTCFKFFKNGYVIIDEEQISLVPYEQIGDKLVWSDKLQGREYIPDASTECLYVDFLRKAVSLEKMKDHIQPIIGYLAHEYKDETTGYIVVLTEECPDPKQGGGSGKNIFANLLGFTTTVKSIPGSQVKYDERFLQPWEGQRIFAVSDVPKKFDFGFLKELSTGTGIIKKLFKNEVVVPCAKMPKFLIGTNYSYEVSDGGLRRRIIPIEFTDFFTKAGGVDIHYGLHFPNGWSDKDWAGYDVFIAQCAQLWLRSALKLSNKILSAGGWRKQFEQSYGQLTREFIESSWEEWKDKFISIENFNKQYTDFMVENGLTANSPYKLSSIKMNLALEEWSKEHNYVFIKDAQERENFRNVKGKQFLKPAPF